MSIDVVDAVEAEIDMVINVYVVMLFSVLGVTSVEESLLSKTVVFRIVADVMVDSVDCSNRVESLVIPKLEVLSNFFSTNKV